MHKLLIAFSMLIIIVGCSSTAMNLPTNDIDIQFYPNLSLHKTWNRTSQIEIVKTQQELPPSTVFLGTLEIIKTIDECNAQDSCNGKPITPHSSSEYLKYYAMKVGANYAELVEDNKLRVRQKEIKYCKVEGYGCNLNNTRYDTKEVCDLGLCKMVPYISDVNSCKNSCKEYDFKIDEGFQKTQRTIASLYRTR